MHLCLVLHCYRQYEGNVEVHFSRLSCRYTTRPVVAMLTFAMRVVGRQSSRAVPALQEPQWTDLGGYVMECLRRALAIVGLDIR